MQTTIAPPTIITYTECILLSEFKDAEFYVKKDARLVLISCFEAGRKEKVRINVSLQEPGASFVHFGFNIASGNETFPFKCTVHHKAERTTSRTRVKSLLTDSAFVNMTGKIIIDKGARDVCASLSHHCLTLSEQARAHTTPILEISEDDVQASHAASVGNIDKEQLFYLQTRGIDQSQAVRIIAEGFFEEMQHMIQDEAAKHHVATFLTDRLCLTS